MTNFSKLALSFFALPALLLASSSALAITTPPECGKFDFDKNGLGCEVRVSAGCEADCTSLNFTAGCEGGCTLAGSAACIGPCGQNCTNQCGPAPLDCEQGCHDECEQPFIQDCQAKHSDRDCVGDAKASCTSYCTKKCAANTDTSCSKVCETCCDGACTSQINMDCDISCYAKLEGGCKVQCQAPEGALFCNGQYVGATDVQSCINALITQGLQIDVSARAEGQCTITLSGSSCDGKGEVNGLGCSAAPGQESPLPATGIVLGLAAFGISAARRRSRKNG